MIAANFRKHADALIRQLELDLAGVQEPATRAAWWQWLMKAGTPQPLEKPNAPAWFKSAVKAAKALAARVKGLCRSLNFGGDCA